MDIAPIFGITASIFTALSLLPQLIKLHKEKSAGDLSMGTLAVLCVGLALWVTYGILISDWILITANSCSLIITVITMVLAMLYKRKS